MEIFDGPYYRRNKFLLSCLGQWPYQNPLHKRIIRLAALVLAVSIVVPEVLHLINVWGHDLDHLVECGSIFGVQTAISMKFSNYILNADKIKTITDRMYNDWKLVGNGPQFEIMKIHAEKGRKLTEFYSVYMYSTWAAYVLMPMMPKFLDLMMPLNESRALTFPLPTEYGDIDPDKYFFPMMFHADCVTLVTMTIIVAMDATYAVYVQHACGLFAVLGDKLERLMEMDVDENADQLDSNRQEEIIYQEIVSCVKMHKDAIELVTKFYAPFPFAGAIESSHVVLFFFVIGLTVFCMSVAGYQMVMNLDKPNEAFRFATFTIAQVAHIFFISWPGQKLIDHSERIHEWAYGARWYNLSTRSKKLLLLMMLRSEEPCKLTAGKLYVVSLANFSMIVRTSVSYFTVLTSFK